MNAAADELLKKSRKQAAAALALSAGVVKEFYEKRGLAHISGALQPFAAMKVIENAATSALRSAEAIVGEVPNHAALVGALAQTAECIDYLHTLATIISGEFSRAIRLAENQEP